MKQFGIYHTIENVRNIPSSNTTIHSKGLKFNLPADIEVLQIVYNTFTNFLNRASISVSLTNEEAR